MTTRQHYMEVLRNLYQIADKAASFITANEDSEYTAADILADEEHTAKRRIYEDKRRDWRSYAHYKGYNPRLNNIRQDCEWHNVSAMRIAFQVGSTSYSATPSGAFNVIARLEKELCIPVARRCRFRFPLA